MIFRFTQKLAKKLKLPRLTTAALDENPLADWTANLFTADQTQYVIVTNTASLYSTVFYGKGITDDGKFLTHALSAIRELMVDDGHEFIYRRFVAPASERVRFASALNRTVTGSMNEMVRFTRWWLTEEELSPFDASYRLNEIPMSTLDYRKPREVLTSLDLVTT